MATIGDSFVDTNGTALEDHVATGSDGGFGWTYIRDAGGFSIHDNALLSTGSTGITIARANTDLGGADQEVQITVAAWDEGSDRFNIGVIARQNGTSTQTFYYAELFIDNGVHTLNLYTVIAGVFTVVADASVTWQPGDVLKMIVLGDAIRVFQNSSLYISHNDDSIPTGNFGGVLRNANSLTAEVAVSAFQAVGSGVAGPGAPVQVVNVEPTANGTTFHAELPEPPTVGNLLVALAHARNQNNEDSITFPAGWTPSVRRVNGAVGGIWWKMARPEESQTVTMTLAVAATPSLVVAEFPTPSGDRWRTDSPVDGTDSSISGPSDAESILVGPNGQSAGNEQPTRRENELIIAMVGLRRTGDATSGFSVGSLFTFEDSLHPTGSGEKSDLGWGFRVVESKALYDTTITWIGAYRAVACLASFWYLGAPPVGMTLDQTPTVNPPRQGNGESIAYKVDLSPWERRRASSPLVLGVFDLADGSDVTGTLMPEGTPTVIAGRGGGATTLLLPHLKNTTPGHTYSIECSFVGGNSQLYKFHFYVRGI